MAADRIERHSRRTRWFHTGAYLVTTGLLVTGWWLYLGGEGHPTPLSRATGLPDVRLHVWLGRALAVWAVIPLFAGRRSIATFLRETFRHDHGDGRWLLRWPTAVFTGRFARHEGEFDPGQRVANVLLVGALILLIGSGLALSVLHGGQVFAVLAHIHLWSTFVVTPLIAGHVLIAVGVLPGYRGVWRAMHLGGRVPLATARRLWPAWTERRLLGLDPTGPADDGHAQARHFCDCALAAENDEPV
jgi:cytochrome b subunit of formate dehydrogenase